MTLTLKTKMKPVVTLDGNIMYRTKLLKSEAVAKAFASCLKANGKFGTSEVVESNRTKKPQYFVQYMPSNPKRRSFLREVQISEREVRAGSEESRYDWSKEGKVWRCVSATGGVYEVSNNTCTCPDFENRCKPLNIKCKHINALDIFKKEGGLA